MWDSDSTAVVADLDVDVSDLLWGLGVADVGELADVLERVGSELAAHILSTLHHHLEAVVVLWGGGGVASDLEVL